MIIIIDERGSKALAYRKLASILLLLLLVNVETVFTYRELNVMITIIERDNEAFSYWELSLLLLNVATRRISNVEGCVPGIHFLLRSALEHYSKSSTIERVLK